MDILKELIRQAIYEELHEGFEFIDDKTVKFNPATNKYVNTSLGKANFRPRKTKLKNSEVIVYSAYSKDSGKEVVSILNAMKGNSDVQISKEDVDKFINRTAIFFTKVLKDRPIDVILKMPSSSPLASNFCDKIIEKLPHSNILTYDNVITKDLTNIAVSDESKFSEKTLQLVYKFVDKVKTTGNFEIKKVHPKFRRFIINWIKIDDSIKNKLVGANVLVVDDYLTTGTTLDETCRTLKLFSPTSIHGITLIK